MLRKASEFHDFRRAKLTLIQKLRSLDLDSLALSDYSKHYLSFLLGDVWETLGRFEQVIEAAIRHTDKPISQMTVVDYGGGVGLLSLLAKEVGFNSVIYNDLFAGSCLDVEILAHACSLEIKQVIPGDADELVKELNNNGIGVDLIVSYDVIEHIYDVKRNFNSFSTLDQRPFSIAYGSGANTRNPFYTYNVKKTQTRVETSDREPVYGQKSTDSLESYRSIRRRIVQNIGPNLSHQEVELLAERTRGLIQADIENQVREYISTGETSYRNNHPTNTCDPLTGNWCEHLLDFNWLTSTALGAGYRPELVKGKYSLQQLSRRTAIRMVFNFLNSLLGPIGFSFSPFYVLVVIPPQWPERFATEDG